MPDPRWSTGAWVNGLAEWTEGDTAFLSVAFTWKLDDAYQKAVYYRALGYKVRAGGPGIFTRKHYLRNYVASTPRAEMLAICTRKLQHAC